MNTLGLAQTGGTCWLHSALNLFLLNDDGFKILWAKMQDVFNMNLTSKAWFLETSTHRVRPDSNT
jgi:hypothetical protein